MAWTVIGKPKKDAQVGSPDEDKVSLHIQWVDDPEVEFTASDPFDYSGRVDPANVGERNAFKAEANAAREVERTRRQAFASRIISIENFMNAA